MRKHYETEADIKKARAVADRVEQGLGLKFVKSGGFTPMWLVYEEESLRYIAMIKCRTVRYDTYDISKKKWEHGVTLALAKGVDFLMIVGWKDGLGVHKYEPNESYFVKERAGRTVQTRDEWDIEDVIAIPIKSFAMEFYE